MSSIIQHGNEDLEKRIHTVETEPAQYGEVVEVHQPSWMKRLSFINMETRGIQPVALRDRTDTQPFNIFTLWWTMGVNLLPVTTGLVGTLFDGLSLEAACLTILFFTLMAAIPPAALGTLGPRTGMRQIVQARYSFGRYVIVLVALFNLATTIGWSIIAAIISGETLSAVSGGSLSWDLGIVISSALSLLIAFLGYKVVHTYERYAWIPAFVAILFATGCGGKLLSMQAPTEPVKGSTVMTFGCTVASYTITWATMASDFAVYMRPDVPKKRMFLYTYCGLTIPVIPVMCLGAAIGGAVPSIPSWLEAFEAGSTGGVMLEMMSATGGFGKFVAIVLAFSLLGNMAGTMYSISVQFQMLLPILAKVPRYLFAIVTTAVIIGVAIPVSTSLEESLENFLGVIAYWGAVFIGVVSTEHLAFRKKADAYDHAIWNDGRKLPLGAAALASVAIPFALIVPSMSVAWYTGPIGKKTGDLGFEFGLVISVICYVPLRTLEKHIMGR